MTDREKEILDLIKKNPMISQKEIAQRLSITRSSVGVHITNLTKKGYIKGKGYIIKEEDYVCIVGGVNVDIQGFPKKSFRLKDSNPGKVKVSSGGVGRNIGENLARLGVETRLISVLGDDVYGKSIVDESRLIGLNMDDCLILKGQSTSTYLSILDEKGDMAAAISYMDIFNQMDTDFINSKAHVIENSKLCILDTNIPEELIRYILLNFKGKEFFLDTVSTAKSMKVKDLIGYFHTIKPNKIEAEILSGIKIKDMDSLNRVGEYFLNKGVKRVFITLGEKGVYYNDGINFGLINGCSNVKVVNATGAGDAFMAAAVYGYLNGFDIDYCTRFSMGASILALSHEKTINPNMSVEEVNRIIEEMKLC